MKIRNIRTFLPSIDFSLSKSFYEELGFDIMWEDNKLIMFGNNENNFFLQNGYNKEWAENMMIQLHVDNLDELHKTIKKLKEKYHNIRYDAIFTAEYGRTFHLIGPAGELWHMTEYNPK